jgi:hypothetical protein
MPTADLRRSSDFIPIAMELFTVSKKQNPQSERKNNRFLDYVIFARHQTPHEAVGRCQNALDRNRSPYNSAAALSRSDICMI